MEIKESKAYKYAQWCMSESNKKVPRYVKKQAYILGKHFKYDENLLLEINFQNARGIL